MSKSLNFRDNVDTGIILRKETIATILRNVRTYYLAKIKFGSRKQYCIFLDLSFLVDKRNTFVDYSCNIVTFCKNLKIF